jgi:hypothetical protein
MKLLNILFVLASIALALIAGAFVGNLCSGLMAMSGSHSLIVAVLVALAVFASGYVNDYLPQGALFMALNAKNISRKNNQKNIGGLAQDHYYAFADDIDVWPDGLNPDFDAAASYEALVNLPTDDIFVMKTGKFFYTFPCILETGQVKSTMVGPLGSHAFENTAVFGNPANLDELTGHLAFIANKPLVVLVRELNGTVKVVGTKEYPAQVDSYESTNGEKVADGNMQKHGFKSYGCIPSPNYLGAIPLQPVVVTP